MRRHNASIYIVKHINAHIDIYIVERLRTIAHNNIENQIYIHEKCENKIPLVCFVSNIVKAFKFLTLESDVSIKQRYVGNSVNISRSYGYNLSVCTLPYTFTRAHLRYAISKDKLVQEIFWHLMCLVEKEW